MIVLCQNVIWFVDLSVEIEEKSWICTDLQRKRIKKSWAWHKVKALICLELYGKRKKIIGLGQGKDWKFMIWKKWAKKSWVCTKVKRKIKEIWNIEGAGRNIMRLAPSKDLSMYEII